MLGNNQFFSRMHMLSSLHIRESYFFLPDLFLMASFFFVGLLWQIWGSIFKKIEWQILRLKVMKTLTILLILYKTALDDQRKLSTFGYIIRRPIILQKIFPCSLFYIVYFTELKLNHSCKVIINKRFFIQYLQLLPL